VRGPDFIGLAFPRYENTFEDLLKVEMNVKRVDVFIELIKAV